MRSKLRRSQRGFSLIELVVVAGMLSVAAALAMPAREEGLFALYNAQRTLIADLRTVRGSAISRGVHFRLEVFDAQTYGIYRMMEAGDEWVADGEAQIERTLAPTVSLSGGGAGYEFNTRGFLVEPTTQATITLVESISGDSGTIDVWPSGQIISSGTT